MQENAIVEQHEVVRALLRALRTKRFLILAGISGTGKTQLARRIAQTAVDIDRQSGTGRGLELMEMSLDDAMAGAQSLYFSRVPGYPEHVRVHDVGTGGSATTTPQHRRRVGFLPVRPDWTDAKRVWGYYNPLTGRFYPTDAIVVLLNAYREFLDRGEDAGNHFLVLDEMNLARVEYYFSDLLSLMESGCSVDPDIPTRTRIGEMARVHPLDSMIVSTGSRGIHDERSEAETQAAYAHVDTGGRKVMSAARTGSVEQMVPLRELDEYRWMYEPLVRGTEFADNPGRTGDPDEVRHPLVVLYPIPPRVAYPPNLTIIGTINVDETTHAFAPKVLDRAFVLEFTEVEYGAAFADHGLWGEIRDWLLQLHGILAPHGLHFGYRVAGEMLAYVAQAGGRLTPDVADFLLMSKVLPKLRGTETHLGVPLEALLQAARSQGWRRAGAKLERMVGQLRQSGFTSFF